MIGLILRTDATTDLELVSLNFFEPIFLHFRDKPIVIIHHHSGASTKTFDINAPAGSRDTVVVHSSDGGEKMTNGNSLFIQNFCRAFNSYDDFNGLVLIFLAQQGVNQLF